MRIPRLFVDPKEIDCVNKMATVSDEKQVHQLLRVLRLSRGAAVDILDGAGSLYRCRLTETSSRCVSMSIEECLFSETTSLTEIAVALPPLRSSRFEWAIEKLTELGVSRIIPLATQRSVVKIEDQTRVRPTGVRGSAAGAPLPEVPFQDAPGKRCQAKLSRWRSIAKEAAEQCERLTIPHVVAPEKLADLLVQKREGEDLIVFMLAERSSSPHLLDFLGNHSDAPQKALIVVGPEGGFTEEELHLASESNLTLVSLGSRILRSETAAIYATSLIASFWNK